MAKFDATNLLSFDVETLGDKEEYGLQPWRIEDKQLRIRSYALGWVQDKKILTRSIGETHTTGVNREQLSEILMQTAKQGKYLLGWNLSYDISVLLAWGLREEVFSNKWLDGMKLWMRAEPRRMTYGLKQAVSLYMPWMRGYEEDVQFDGPIDKLCEYNERDVEATLFLAIKFLSVLTEKEKRGALIEAQASELFADADLRGIPIDPSRIPPIIEVLDKQEAAARTTLEPHVNLAEVGVKNSTGLNVRSPKQLQKVLYEQWRLPILDKSAKTQAPSTSKETLLQLAIDDPRAKAIVDLRQALNLRKKYVTNVIESIKYHDNQYHAQRFAHHTYQGFVTRPQCKKPGTYTGRATYSSKQNARINGKNTELQTGIALHQWKREDIYRQIIKAPPGFLLTEHDFSGQEMRLMAELSGDETMIWLFETDMDGHAYMGCRITSLSYDRMKEILAKGDQDPEFKKTDEYKTAKRGRYLGKFANLSMQYRTSANKLRVKALSDYDMVLTGFEAKTIRETYLSTFPGVPAYWARQIDLAKRQGFVETLGGRRVYFKPEDWSRARSWSSESTALNFPIQGTGADQKDLALAAMKSYYRSHNGFFGWDLHDGLFSFFPEETAEQNAEDLTKLLSNLPYESAWGYKPRLKFPVDGSFGLRWGQMKGV